MCPGSRIDSRHPVPHQPEGRLVTWSSLRFSMGERRSIAQKAAGSFLLDQLPQPVQLLFPRRPQIANPSVQRLKPRGIQLARPHVLQRRLWITSGRSRHEDRPCQILVHANKIHLAGQPYT